VVAPNPKAFQEKGADIGEDGLMSVQEEAKRREKLEYYCNQILRWNKWLVSSFTRNTERTRILESDQLRCEGAGPRLGTLLR